jgi:hypothetical protein
MNVRFGAPAAARRKRVTLCASRGSRAVPSALAVAAVTLLAFLALRQPVWRAARGDSCARFAALRVEERPLLPTLQPCWESATAASLLHAHPLLAGTNSAEYARIVVASARSWPHYGRAGAALDAAAHGRAFFDMLNATTHACPDAAPVGDTAVGERKFICGAARWAEARSAPAAAAAAGGDPLLSPSCAVYSIGSNLVWDFEDDLLARTPACRVYTLDCTVPPWAFTYPSARVVPIHACLDTSSWSKPNKWVFPSWWMHFEPAEGVMDSLGHGLGGAEAARASGGLGDAEVVDLWKVDCEGCEFDLVRSWMKPGWQHVGAHSPPRASRTARHLPAQLALEVHGAGDDGKVDCAYADVERLAEDLAHLGYVLTHREDNPNAFHVAEFTFVRAFC